MTRASMFFRLKGESRQAEIAWQEFHDRYARIIERFAKRMGTRGEDVNEVVQNVMLGFFSVSPHFVYDPQKGSFRGYLKTCTVRECARNARIRAKHNGGGPLEFEAADPKVDAAWNDAWDVEKLRQALEDVRKRYAKPEDRAQTFRAFEMYVLLQRDPKDVAAELGMSVDSVYAAKTRISKALKETVKEFDDLHN